MVIQICFLDNIAYWKLFQLNLSVPNYVVNFAVLRSNVEKSIKKTYAKQWGFLNYLKTVKHLYLKQTPLEGKYKNSFTFILLNEWMKWKNGESFE